MPEKPKWTESYTAVGEAREAIDRAIGKCADAAATCRSYGLEKAASDLEEFVDLLDDLVEKEIRLP